MNKLSEKYVAILVEKNLLHPIPPRDVYQTLKNLLYAFVAKDNPAKDSSPTELSTRSSDKPWQMNRNTRGTLPSTSSYLSVKS